MPSAELLKALRRAVLNEMEKRARQRGLDLGKDYRTILYERLDSMKARREELNNPYPKSTKAELDDLVAYLAERAAATAKP
jgi:hypothetical protein